MGTPSRKPEIRIVLRKRLVRELGIINLFEFFTQHSEHIEVQFFLNYPVDVHGGPGKKVKRDISAAIRDRNEIF